MIILIMIMIMIIIVTIMLISIIGGEARDVTGQWVGTAGLRDILAELERTGPLSHRVARVVPLWVHHVLRQMEAREDFPGACSHQGLFYAPTLCLGDQWAREGRRWREADVLLSFVPAAVHTPADNFGVHTRETPRGDGLDAATEGEAEDKPRFQQDAKVVPQNLISTVGHFLHMLGYSPDVFFFHPDTFTCSALPRIDLRVNMPKVVYVPINPLIPPPVEVLTDPVVPHYDRTADAGMPWLAHCSLAGVMATVERHAKGRYALLHVEHAFAVLVLRPLLLPTRLIVLLVSLALLVLLLLLLLL